MIEIRQAMQPISTTSCWQEMPFTRVVWRYPQAVTPQPSPHGFVPGLLIAYVDGEQVTLADLDVVLATIGTTRAAIVMAIQSRGL